MDDFQNWRGKTVWDNTGTKIGSVGELYVDDENDSPAWLTVKTGLFGTKENFVPIALARVKDDEIIVEAPAEQVKNAPKVDIDEHLSNDEERALYDYYRQDWGGNEKGKDGQAGGLTDQEAGLAAVATAEDRDADVGAEGPASGAGSPEEGTGADGDVVGQYRLRKYKVREEKTINVPVEREEVRLEPVEGSTENRDPTKT